VSVSGRAPDGAYCAAIVPNGVWTIGAPLPAETVATATVTSAGGVIPSTEAWGGATAGSYDVVLIPGDCSTPGAVIVAAFDEGPAAGFDVGAGGDPIPALSRGAFAAFALLLTTLGVWALAGRR
jgi:hypothetical protein